MRHRLPLELVATALVALSVPIGILGMPSWAIFFSWAALGLAGGNQHTKRLTIAMVTGTIFAVLIGISADALTAHTALPGWAATVIAIAVLNPCMLLLGRQRAFSLIPGMFIAVSTIIATRSGSYGPYPGELMWSAACALGMLLLGIGYSYAFEYLAKPRAQATT